MEPTRFKTYYFDPETGVSVLVSEGEMERLDTTKLSPKLQAIMAKARADGQRLERDLKAQVRRKSA